MTFFMAMTNLQRKYETSMKKMDLHSDRKKYWRGVFYVNGLQNY